MQFQLLKASVYLRHKHCEPGDVKEKAEICVTI